MRLSLLYGPSRNGTPSYIDKTLAELAEGRPQRFFEDEFRTPLDLASAAGLLVRLTEDGVTGRIHLGGRERISRFQLMRRIAVARGFDPRCPGEPASGSDVAGTAPPTCPSTRRGFPGSFRSWHARVSRRRSRHFGREPCESHMDISRNTSSLRGVSLQETGVGFASIRFRRIDGAGGCLTWAATAISLLGPFCSFCAQVSEPASTRAEAAAPTFHRDVKRSSRTIVRTATSRPGRPVPLMNYEQARKRAADIESVTGDRKMPPWPASATEGGPFRDARVLPKSEIAAIAAWVAAGCPEGDAKDAPARGYGPPTGHSASPTSSSSCPPPMSVSAEGQDEHRVFVIPSGLTEGKSISAVDFKPGNPRVVHHILAAFDTAGRARSSTRPTPRSAIRCSAGSGFSRQARRRRLGRRERPQRLPDGLGRYLPAGSDILLQVHYHKNGKPEADLSLLGIYFAHGPVDKQVIGDRVMPPQPGLFRRPELLIPAGNASYEVAGSKTINEGLARHGDHPPHALARQGFPHEGRPARRLDRQPHPDRRLEL